MSELDSACLTQVHYECRTLAEGKQVARLLASLCPNPTAHYPGLVELIVNAIEHGNLELDTVTKNQLLQNGTWLDEVDRRYELPRYRSRRVHIALRRSRTMVSITIRDEGVGFDHARYTMAGSNRSVDAAHRGIAIAQCVGFESVEYRGSGSEVCVTVRRVVEQISVPITDQASTLEPRASGRETHESVTRSKPHLVLVADDEPVTRMLLFAALRKDYDVAYAVDGHDALARYQALRPDLMLVDVHMPFLSGSRVCELVRVHETDTRTAVLLMSSQNDEALVLDALARGADDFVLKPINQRVLLSKIATQLNGKRTRDALAFQRGRLVELQRKVAHEHFLAQSVLKNILERAELSHPSIQCAVTPMSDFDGDVALVARLPNGGFRMMVSDLAGHGLPAAFGTIPISLLFYSTARQGLDLEAAVAQLNRELCGVLPLGLFAASAVFEVSADARTLRVWNGGIPDLALRRRCSREVVRFASQNLPIGIGANDTVTVEEVPVEPGDIVFAMSDGVVETRNESGELFGIQRVIATLAADRPPACLFDDLRAALVRFGHGQQDDDVTMLAHTVGR